MNKINVHSHPLQHPHSYIHTLTSPHSHPHTHGHNSTHIRTFTLAHPHTHIPTLTLTTAPTSAHLCTHIPTLTPTYTHTHAQLISKVLKRQDVRDRTTEEVTTTKPRSAVPLKTKPTHIKFSDSDSEDTIVNDQ